MLDKHLIHKGVEYSKSLYAKKPRMSYSLMDHKL